MKIKDMITRIRQAFMSRKGKLLSEAALYGLLAAIYSSLFFFGALYPQFGIPSKSIVYEEQEESEEAEETEETDEEEQEEVVYKSLILERLKDWF